MLTEVYAIVIVGILFEKTPQGKKLPAILSRDLQDKNSPDFTAQNEQL